MTKKKRKFGWSEFYLGLAIGILIVIIFLVITDYPFIGYSAKELRADAYKSACKLGCNEFCILSDCPTMEARNECHSYCNETVDRIVFGNNTFN
jgi:hypothetical protein